MKTTVVLKLDPENKIVLCYLYLKIVKKWTVKDPYTTFLLLFSATIEFNNIFAICIFVPKTNSDFFFQMMVKKNFITPKLKFPQPPPGSEPTQNRPAKWPTWAWQTIWTWPGRPMRTPAFPYLPVPCWQPRGSATKSGHFRATVINRVSSSISIITTITANMVQVAAALGVAYPPL